MALLMALGGIQAMRLSHAQTDASPFTPLPPPTVQRALIPGGMADEKTFADGCWVRFFDGVGYRGEQLLIAGPLDVARMRDTGEPLRDWDSLVVGPRALVIMYDAEDFQQPSLVFTAGRRIADLTKTTGRIADIRSVRVNCSLA